MLIALFHFFFASVVQKLRKADRIAGLLQLLYCLLLKLLLKELCAERLKLRVLPSLLLLLFLLRRQPFNSFLFRGFCIPLLPRGLDRRVDVRLCEGLLGLSLFSSSLFSVLSAFFASSASSLFSPKSAFMNF